MNGAPKLTIPFLIRIESVGNICGYSTTTLRAVAGREPSAMEGFPRRSRILRASARIIFSRPRSSTIGPWDLTVGAALRYPQRASDGRPHWAGRVSRKPGQGAYSPDLTSEV